MKTPADDDRAPLDPRGRRPICIIVAERIEKRIRAGEFGEIGRLPNRGELAAWYDTSNATIKSAIRLLRERGLVEVIPWRGTFTL